MNEEETAGARPERRDAAENRQRILEAAIQLFEQFGVEQVSMNQIATEAKIGSGTLYRRYRSKSELCLDLIKDNLDLLFADMEAYLQENRSAPPTERLKEVLRLFIRFREKKAQLLAGVEDNASSSRPKSRTKGPIYHELHELIVGLFDEMTISGPSHVHSLFRADMLLLALSSDSYLFQREVRGHTSEMIWEELCFTFIPQP